MGSITPKLTYLKQTKEAIKAAIEAKGVTVDTEIFRDYVGLILSISTSDSAAPTVTVSADGNVKATSSGGTKTVKLSSSHDSDFKAENIKSGVTIFGVTGTLKAEPITETVSGTWDATNRRLTLTTSKNISKLCNMVVFLQGTNGSFWITYDPYRDKSVIMYPYDSSNVGGTRNDVTIQGTIISTSTITSTGVLSSSMTVKDAVVSYIPI